MSSNFIPNVLKGKVFAHQIYTIPRLSGILACKLTIINNYSTKIKDVKFIVNYI